jgi:hypothetical protein
VRRKWLITSSRGGKGVQIKLYACLKISQSFTIMQLIQTSMPKEIEIIESANGNHRV